MGVDIAQRNNWGCTSALKRRAGNSPKHNTLSYYHIISLFFHLKWESGSTVHSVLEAGKGKTTLYPHLLQTLTSHHTQLHSLIWDRSGCSLGEENKSDHLMDILKSVHRPPMWVKAILEEFMGWDITDDHLHCGSDSESWHPSGAHFKTYLIGKNWYHLFKKIFTMYLNFGHW